jgi:hypothetical protein
MDATGVYWKPVWAILEEEFDCLLCKARHVKQVPGRKTDVSDAAWLCQLLEAGLLQRSFVPPKPIRALRNLTRSSYVKPRMRCPPKARSGAASCCRLGAGVLSARLWFRSGAASAASSRFTTSVL